MYMAAIGDIHGNLPALEAVLSAIDEAGIQTVVNTGDLVVGAEWPNEVVDLLRARNIPAVQGEWDRHVVHFQRKQQTLQKKLEEAQYEALIRTHEVIESHNLEYLRGLPKQRVLEVEGIVISICHGTPTSQADVLEEDDLPFKFQRVRELTNSPIVVCGATHKAYSRTVDGTLFVNPGSVGMQPNLATYAIIDTETDPWTARIEEVAYS